MTAGDPRPTKHAKVHTTTGDPGPTEHAQVHMTAGDLDLPAC